MTRSPRAGAIRVDGEPGHANVAFDSPYRGGAGHTGCYEAIYSGSALERQIVTAVPDLANRTAAELWEAFYQEVATGAAWANELLEEWAEGVGRAWANVLNRICSIEAIVYVRTTAEQLLAIPRVARRLRATIQRIAMFPEHQSPQLPILKAQEKHRAILGAVIVYEKECRERTSRATNSFTLLADPGLLPFLPATYPGDESLEPQ